MKHKFRLSRASVIGLIALLVLDIFYAILIWIADIESFYALLVAIVLTTIIAIMVMFSVSHYHVNKRKKAFLTFINNPDEYNEEVLLKLCSSEEKEVIIQLSHILSLKEKENKDLLMRVSDYEEYVETWAHEIKTPLSLLTLILDNRKEEIPKSLHFKFDFIRNRMQESVNQMLFYARLKGGKNDYLYEYIDLKTCMDMVLEDYGPLLDENGFSMDIDIADIPVYSDKRSLIYILSQIISNAIKYKRKDNIPHITIGTKYDDVNITLSICDNGVGVHQCDLPYIFEKGFTGDSEDGRKKATGMGLYLAKAFAKNLNIELEAISKWGCGFNMKVTFPRVHSS